MEHCLLIILWTALFRCSFLCRARKEVSKQSSINEFTSTSSLSANWCEAMNEEVKELEEHHVFEEIDKELHMKILKSKWVHTIKRKSDGTIDRFKGRFVACGYAQKQGIDFQDTFAPVIPFPLVRLLLTNAAVKGMHVRQLDIKTAFLNGEIGAEVYNEPPKGYSNKNKVWKLVKSLYGLKQAPLCWHKKLCDVLKKLEL